MASRSHSIHISIKEANLYTAVVHHEELGLWSDAGDHATFVGPCFGVIVARMIIVLASGVVVSFVVIVLASSMVVPFVVIVLAFGVVVTRVVAVLFWFISA